MYPYRSSGLTLDLLREVDTNITCNSNNDAISTGIINGDKVVIDFTEFISK